MTSVETIISISSQLWLKLYSLFPELPNDFVNDFYGLFNQEDSQQKISSLSLDNSPQVILLFRCDRISISTLLTTEKKDDNQDTITVKIVEILSNNNLNEKLAKFLQNNPNISQHIESSFESSQINDIDLISSISNDNELIISEYCYQQTDFLAHFIYSKTKGNQRIILLSPNQEEIINKTPTFPTVITGNKGTGKTTTAIYSALLQQQKLDDSLNEKILFLTKDKSTAQQCRKFSQNLISDNDIDFTNYLSLAKNIIEKYPLIFNNKFLSQRQVTFYKFYEDFFKNQKIISLNPEYLWEEIRQLIKGSFKSIRGDNNLITLKEYLALTNQSIFPSNSDFTFIYNLATYYQEWLVSQNYWDELDLTQYLLRQLPSNYQGDFEIIYIDGIEHFSELQIQFVLRLLKINSHETYFPKIFFVGNHDNYLKINNITWNRLKKVLINSFHKLPQWEKIRELIENKELNYNFIYNQNIVNLQSKIASLAGISLNNQSWLNIANKPLIISEINYEFIMAKSFLNIDSAIIVFNEEEKVSLKNIFSQDSERIISFDEVDNLDFQQVLVWKPFSETNNIFNSQIGNLSNVDNPKIYKEDVIYLCSNLARKKLYFYDDTLDSIWSDSTVSELVEIGYETELESMFDTDYNVEERVNITEKYLEIGNKKSYQIAEQIYKIYEDEFGLNKVNALWEEDKGNYGKAGDIWNKIGFFDYAINCWNEVDQKLWLAKWSVLDAEEWQKRGVYFESIRNYKLAKLCHEKANDFEGKLRCLEQDNQWELAGDECLERNFREKAHHYYELADQFYRQSDQIKLAVKMWTKLNQWDKVALIWEDLNQWEKAGNCWQKHGDVEKAANCWQKAQKWNEAQKCWQELGNWQELALSYEHEEKWTLAAQTWLKVSEMEKAAICYQKGNQWQSAETIWRELGYWGFVAIALQQQNKWEEAAQVWSKTNPNELQGLCYEQAQQWDKAEKAWLEAKNWTRSILACEKQGKWQEAAESWENLGEWQKAGEAWEKINQLEKAALCFEEGELWYLAENHWQTLQKSDRLAENLQKQEKWQESALIWEKLQEWEKAGKAWQQTGDKEKAALCFENGELWHLAEDCWQELENWEKLEYVCKKQGSWQKAALDWLKVNQIEKAALCYEQCDNWEKAAKYWQQSENWEKSANAYENLQEWEKAAENYIKGGNHEKAGSCYEKCQQWEKAEECWRKSWKWEKLAKVCEHQQKWEEAGKAWFSIKEIEKAGLCYEKAENWQKAEECWRQLNNWQRLAIVCENQEQWEESAQLWQFLSEWQKAALACLKMDDLETAIKYYEKGGYTQEAEICRQKLNS